MTSPKGRKKKTLEDYEFIKNESSKYNTSELGKGSYGTVKKVKDKHTGKVYAMKIMNKKSIFEYSTKENLKREISIQRGISHPHVVKLFTYFEDNENVYLILEFAENGSLFQYLRKRKMFSENEAFVYFFQTCLGIDYLHKRNVIHRDLKPENLLLDEEGNIKLCDFGWSAESLTIRQTFCGTIDYMAPEMIKNHPHDNRLDIWCLGILLYEMLHGYAPFKGRTDQEKCSNISMNKPIEFDPSLSPEVVDLIKKILQPVPINRISMLNIFKHPWMKKSEKIYDIDIMSYVEQQNEQIRELHLAEGKALPKEIEDSFSDKSEKKDSQTSNKAGESAKIITIYDNSAPLFLPQKNLSEENFKQSYNESTKGSETSSTRSESGSGHESKNNDYIFKSFQTGSNQEKGQLYKTQEKNYYAGGYGYPEKNSGYNMEDNFPAYQESMMKNDRNQYLSKTRSQNKGNANLDLSLRCNTQGNEKLDSSRSNSVEKKHKAEFGNEKKKYERSYTKANFAINEDSFGEGLEPQRMSRISKRNLEIGNKRNPIQKRETKEVGLFEQLLVGLGCIARDAKKVNDF
jgi:serine/threonine protein kinase